jgi:hypothetical protein
MPLLGKVITRTEAENEISAYLKIRQQCFTAVVSAVGTIPAELPEGAQYYASQKLSFVFERSMLEKVLQLGGDQCNGIRVYLGAAPETQTSPSVTKGSPTLLMVPCKITPEPNFVVENIVPTNMEGEAAVQWPGGVIRDINDLTPNLATDNATSVTY